MLRSAGPADAMAIASVQVASWQAAYAGLLPEAYLRGLAVPDAAARWERLLRLPEPLVFVAQVAGQVVGFASGGPEREGDPIYRGELYAIYLLPEHQARGLGRSLLAAVAGVLGARGLGSMLAWVLRDNLPARAFYEALGGRYLRQHPLEIGGVTVPEVAYGWAAGSIPVAGWREPR